MSPCTDCGSYYSLLCPEIVLGKMSLPALKVVFICIIKGASRNVRVFHLQDLVSYKRLKRH